MKNKHLISYIAPGAPAIRRLAKGGEPYLRPEFGFTPKWYRKNLDINFGEQWHTSPAYRQEKIIRMGAELKKRFPNIPIGGISNYDKPADLLTGVYGACAIAAIYGIGIKYFSDNWPCSQHAYFDDKKVDKLEPPNLDSNKFFAELMGQVEWIADNCGTVEGYINWQGVLNNAYRLRGEAIFSDMLLEPNRAKRIFDCVADTMEQAIGRLYDRQRRSGFDVKFCTVSNCLVNMISPRQYEEFLLPYDKRFSETFSLIGIHNCAWKADPYMKFYATVPNLGYIDMGLDSDLITARELFPNARRALMYTPMDLANKSTDEIEKDLEKIAKEYAPCDVVLADIEADTSDEKIVKVNEICKKLSR
ncbi:MAG: uroporphyrinogen decarboxylase family protein [Sedimentisphaerales bacterium]